jgi:hypothetical protein
MNAETELKNAVESGGGIYQQMFVGWIKNEPAVLVIFTPDNNDKELMLPVQFCSAENVRDEITRSRPFGWLRLAVRKKFSRKSS